MTGVESAKIQNCGTASADAASSGHWRNVEAEQHMAGEAHEVDVRMQRRELEGLRHSHADAERHAHDQPRRAEFEIEFVDAHWIAPLPWLIRRRSAAKFYVCAPDDEQKATRRT